MSPQTSFEPGKWYLLVTCKHCGAKHILPDPSGGQDMEPANSTCPNCLRVTQYTGDSVERYSHDAD